MEKKKYCGHCSHIDRQEKWCYELNNHRKLLQAPCTAFNLRKELEQAWKQ